MVSYMMLIRRIQRLGKCNTHRQVLFTIVVLWATTWIANTTLIIHIFQTIGIVIVTVQKVLHRVLLKKGLEQ